MKLWGSEQDDAYEGPLLVTLQLDGGVDVTQLCDPKVNVRGEPIVNTPLDAFKCFMGTNLDKLVIGNCILDKNTQNPNLKLDYSNNFEKD